MKLSLLVALFMALSPSARATPPELMVLGNQIVTKVGHCPVRLKGVNVPSLEWSNLGEGPSAANRPLATIQYISANWLVNFVRLPLNQDRWLGTACGSDGVSYRNRVIEIVNWCNANDVYVLLDLHWNDLGTAGANQACTSGQHDMPDDNSQAFWVDVAGNTQIANNPAVFFDLYNEPGGAKSSSALTNNAAGWALWRDGGTVPASSDGVAYHSPGMQGLLSAIRGAGANNMVWAGGRDWAFNLTGIVNYAAALTDTAQGNGVVYATHIYPFKWGGNGCVVPACFDGAVPQAVLDNYPVMVTEFGPNVGDPEGFLQPLLAWIDQHNLSFSAWCMHTGAEPILISDWSFTPTSYFGAPFLNKLLGTNPMGCNPATATVSPTISPSPTVTVTPTPLPSCGNTVLYRINASGPAFTDGAGDAWSADGYYVGGSNSTTSSPISGTTDDALFQTARWANPLGYNFPVPNGSYRVELFESENYWSAVGKRIFSVGIEGNTVLSGHDTFAATGAQNTAEILSFTATVSDGMLNIVLSASADNAQVAAIRITHLGPVCPDTPTPSPTFSVSPSFTFSPTISPSFTASPIVSATATPTISPTWTASPTVTVTPTVSQTYTPAPSGGPLEVQQLVGMPNPNARVMIVKLSSPAERVVVDLYSASYAHVAQLTMDHAAAGYNTLRFNADWLALPNGIYFALAQAWQGDEHAQSGAIKLMKLR